MMNDYFVLYRNEEMSNDNIVTKYEFNDNFDDKILIQKIHMSILKSSTPKPGSTSPSFFVEIYREESSYRYVVNKKCLAEIALHFLTRDL